MSITETEIDLSWVTFLQESNSIICDGFEPVSTDCSNEATHRIIFKGCPNRDTGYLCLICCTELKNSYGIMCECDHDIVITRIERIK